MPTEATLPENLLYQFLSTTGDGLGVTNANGDYEATPTDFYIQPPPGVHYHVNRLIIFIRANGNVVASDYGSGPALTNGGVRFVVEEEGSIIQDFTSSAPVVSNAEWAQFDYDVQNSTLGAGDNFLASRWSFFKAGSPEVETSVLLRGDLQARLVVKFTDDMTSQLLEHTFNAQGRKHNAGIDV